LLAPLDGVPVRVPALYIAGDRDPVLKFPGMDRHIASLPNLVPQLRSAIMLPGCGHINQEDRAAEVNSARAVPQFIEVALPEVLTKYARTYPGIEVQLVEDGGGGLLKRVRQGDLHLVVGAWPTGGLESQPLYPARVLAVVRRGHRLAGRDALEVAELAGSPLLLLGREFQHRVLFDEACQRAHFEPSVRLESRSPQSLIALAEAGHDIAIVPSAARLDIFRVAIAGVVDGGRPLGWWAHAVWDSRRYLPSYARGFIKMVEDYAKTSYPGHQLGHLTRAVPRPATL
jgi:DNA-binding transcriptional LysR family regulator